MNTQPVPVPLLSAIVAAADFVRRHEFTELGQLLELRCMLSSADHAALDREYEGNIPSEIVIDENTVLKMPTRDLPNGLPTIIAGISTYANLRDFT
jgi:hypothetical protein